MNITKITNEANVKYDPFLVETLVKPNASSDISKTKTADKAD